MLIDFIDDSEIIDGAITIAIRNKSEYNEVEVSLVDLDRITVRKARVEGKVLKGEVVKREYVDTLRIDELTRISRLVTEREFPVDFRFRRYSHL